MRWFFGSLQSLLKNRSALKQLWSRGFSRRPPGGGKKTDYRDYSEDFFAETRMSFGEHIEVLRTHLLKAIYAFMIMTCIGLYYGQALVQMIAQPIDDQLEAFHKKRLEKAGVSLREGDPKWTELNKPKQVTMAFDRQELAGALGVKLPEAADQPRVELHPWIRPAEVALATSEAQRQATRPGSLVSLTVMEMFLVWMKVAMFFGIVASSPYVFYQLWSFVAAGLYPHERYYVNLYLPVSLVLFLLGVVLCEYVVLPTALKYLLSFNEEFNVEPELRINEWLTFAVLTPLIFGLSFQLPLIMLFLERIGIASLELYGKYRRIAYFVMCLITVLLTPSPDPYSFIPLMLSLWGLYELGLILCRFLPRDQPPEEEEMVEVQ